MKQLAMQPGANVIAVRSVGPVAEGTPGVVTGFAEMGSLFWKRPMYMCSFLGNLKCAMKPAEIDGFEHGYSRAKIEIDPSKLSVADQLKNVFPANR
jgi:hypothetical protein